MAEPRYCRATSWDQRGCDGHLEWYVGPRWTHAAFCRKHLEAEYRFEAKRHHPTALKAKVYDITDIISERREQDEANADREYGLRTGK